ncbi:MAG: FtsX-like permease family protein, partial [Lachnospiraceae bacterium]|nr:FtsX-like permease family protein [Lachnospiraceae bacterium]
EYQQLETIRIPYLGYLQKQGDFYIVSDEEYESLITKESELYLYNYKVGNDSAFVETKKEIDNFASELKEKGDMLGRVAIDPNNSEKEWMKLVHSICIFMFLVFVVASGCIMYMKLYNDAYEEKERYSVMCKIGLDDKVLQKSIAKEVGTAYFIPFFIMVISAYYSVLALGKKMHTDLFAIYLLSVMIVLAVYGLYYGLSVRVYQKMINII